MTISKKRTAKYLKKVRVECPKCHHHGRDVKLRHVVDKQASAMTFKVRCNNCVGKSW